jgi:hypothetical protein
VVVSETVAERKHRLSGHRFGEHFLTCSVCRQQAKKPLLEPEPEPIPPPAERLFTTVELVRITGASYRQLDNWDRVGMVKPVQSGVGSGMQRRYTLDAVVQARGLALLMKTRQGTGGPGRGNRVRLLGDLPSRGVVVGESTRSWSVYDDLPSAAAAIRKMPACWAIDMNEVRAWVLSSLSKAEEARTESRLAMMRA